MVDQHLTRNTDGHLMRRDVANDKHLANGECAAAAPVCPSVCTNCNITTVTASTTGNACCDELVDWINNNGNTMNENSCTNYSADGSFDSPSGTCDRLWSFSVTCSGGVWSATLTLCANSETCPECGAEFISDTVQQDDEADPDGCPPKVWTFDLTSGSCNDASFTMTLS